MYVCTIIDLQRASSRLQATIATQRSKCDAAVMEILISNLSEYAYSVISSLDFCDLCYTTKNYWNKGVMTLFEYVNDLPNKTVPWSKHGYEYVSKLLDADQQKNPTPTKS
ncbi:hypothetical protein C0J52_06681 [Blattella germanica]|nr:hypothetical protein C0J52_06681 [Blattella germanica]